MMEARLRHALYGLIAGFVTGLLAWMIGGAIGPGGWMYFSYVVGGFMLVEGLIGFLLPKKASDFFIDLIVGFFENASI